jgi:aspartyl-tRNA(Asn)/glutamyl-tRNA(Gln) amidotransferase subunit B
MNASEYELVVGLEVHVQLLTRTKLFCRCSTRFGGAPNTQTCPVCIGLPGALPVMNRQAFLLGLKTGLALNCRVPAKLKWDRKNYFYPDLPKGYQISQYDLPLAQEGYLEISDPQERFATRRIRIIRAHLEEDAGKSMHDEAAGKHDSRIDLNRAGTPLLEIVSYPDLRSPLEAKTFLNELKLLLTYLQVSDCNMQEGSLRVDANVNLHISTAQGVVATPIVEVKNMNSFRAVERALEYEAARQFAEWQATGTTIQDAPKQTRGWDDRQEITVAQRQKEESSDYRYFPDPDLAPVVVFEAMFAEVRSQTAELPAALRQRLQTQYGVEPYAADVIVNQGRPAVDYFVCLAERLQDGRRAGNWVQQDVLRAVNEKNLTIESFPVPAEALADLLERVDRGELTNNRAKDVFQHMLESGSTVTASLAALGIEKVDPSELESLCRQLLEDNPRIVDDVRGGKQQAIGALIGQAKKRNPNADPADVKRICLELIDKM